MREGLGTEEIANPKIKRTNRFLHHCFLHLHEDYSILLTNFSKLLAWKLFSQKIKKHECAFRGTNTKHSTHIFYKSTFIFFLFIEIFEGLDKNLSLSP